MDITTNLFLATIPYQTRTQLDLLFQHSTRVLTYLGGTPTEDGIFLSLITESQKQALEQNALTVKVLEQATDISRYTLLWHAQTNQEHLLQPYGETFIITPHYTLLKLPAGKTFAHTDAITAQFFEAPFSETVVTPPLRTKTAAKLTPIVTLPPQVTITPQQSSFFSLSLILILLLVGLLVFFFIKAIAKKNH